MTNRLIRIILRVVFVLSLLLNAAVIGIGLQLAEIRSYYGPSETRLPRDLRRSFIEAAKADEALAAEAALLSEARTKMYDLSRAKPVDRVALEAAMAQVRAQMQVLQEKNQALLLETVIESQGD
ncbi:MAG: hypothetical protein AAFQ64_17515 [Pseudomonadota bacterium]